MDPSHHSNSSEGGEDPLESFMMTSIPRRSLPPSRPPLSSASESTNAAAAGTVQTEDALLEHMTIPRRTLSSKPSSIESSSGLQSGTKNQQPQAWEQEQEQPKKKNRHVSILTEYPFVVRIRLKGVSMEQGGIPWPPSPFTTSFTDPAITNNDLSLIHI